MLLLYVFPWESRDEQNTDWDPLAEAASGAASEAHFSPSLLVFRRRGDFPSPFFPRLALWLPIPCSSSSQGCLCPRGALGWLRFWNPKPNPAQPHNSLWAGMELSGGPTDTHGSAGLSTQPSTALPWSALTISSYIHKCRGQTLIRVKLRTPILALSHSQILMDQLKAPSHQQVPAWSHWAHTNHGIREQFGLEGILNTN